jgi:DNA modification methylase
MGRLILGNSLAVLKTLPKNYFHSIVTDPPAGISFMNKEWDGDFGGRDNWINWMQSIFMECKRVLKPGGHCFVWAIPRTSHWTATALENAGFEIRDIITHLFGSGFPKSLDISKAIDKSYGAEREVIGEYKNPAKTLGNGLNMDGGKAHKTVDLTAPSTFQAKQWQGWGTALKPASEHWILCRKPISEKTVALNVMKWGVGGINIDGCRVEAKDQSKLEKNWDRTQSAAAKGSAAMGGGFKEIDLSNRKAQGRFPANLILSHTEHCFEDHKGWKCDPGCPCANLDKQSGEVKSGGGSKGKRGGMFGDGSENPNRANSLYFDTGGASRFFYCSKVSRKERGEGNNHPTVKPLKLMEYLIKLITPKGGIVLDPFMGSGSTVLAAESLSVNYVGIEKDEAYYKMMVSRKIYKDGLDKI